MILLWSILITVAATAVAVTVMLLVRRRAPDGSWFADGDRAAGVFGVLATGFSVLLGFVVFLAFTSYDNSSSGAEAESRLVAQQFETAQFLPEAVSAKLSAQLVCYGRSVVFEEWPRMKAGGEGATINPWAIDLFRTLKSADPRTAAEQAAYGKWLDQTSDREDARADRLHGADGVIPSPLWLVLFLAAAIIFAFMLFFADTGEGAVTQGMLMGSVTAVIAAMLLLLWFLDTPFHSGFGSVSPSSMERTLELLDQEMQIVGLEEPLPCDERGVAVAR